ncbi:MAG: cyclic nucleotide-binding domain-containing protein [Candidatus Manganitrophaceae bacterium]|nr:MAG: cyclic nucleotide-binding domain-containing protein [Candidatus Manganitrophaceae bacterium]
MKPEFQERVQLLRSVPFFAALSEKDLSDIAVWSSRTSYKKGEVIVREGTPGKGLYVLITGRADVSVKKGGAERVVGVLLPADVFGEMSLIEARPRSGNVTAVEETECLYLDARIFLEKVASHPEILIGLLKTICLRLRQTVEELRGF